MFLGNARFKRRVGLSVFVFVDNADPNLHFKPTNRYEPEVWRGRFDV
jgi:hypothetical protein